MRLKILTIAILILATSGIALFLTPDHPVDDGYERFALSISEHGIYGRIPDTAYMDRVPAPSVGRPPLYAAFLSVFASLHPPYRDYLVCFYNVDTQNTCDDRSGLTLVRSAQMIVGLCGVFFVYLTARLLGARDAFALLTTLIIGLLWTLSTYLNGYSEAIAIPLHAMLTYFTARCLVSRTRWPDALIIGIVLALLTLTRFAYQYYLPIILTLLIIAKFTHDHLNWRQTGGAVFLVIFGFSLFVGPWVVRNKQVSDEFTLGAGGESGVLMVRMMYNRMNFQEYVTAFLYWFPIIGDNISERILPEAFWQRLNTDTIEGFRQQGLNQRFDLRSRGYSTEEINSLAIDAIRNNIVSHIAVTLPLFIRGSRYAVFFLPLLPFFFYYVIRHKRWTSFLALSAGWFIWVFHASFTHFNVRYGWPLGFDFAVMAALAATWIYDDMKQRKTTKTLPE